MTDYKNLKLIATTSPHIRAAENTKSIMLDVIIAMIPALAMGIWYFGPRALTVTCVSVIGSVFFEWLYRKVTKQTQSVNDLSAVVTGILLAFVCPVTVTYWAILIGDFFAIFLVKQLFGGIGCNFVNPALAARAFMLSWATMMSTWVVPHSSAPIVGSTADVVTSATPLAFLHVKDLAGLKATGVSISDMFMGNIGGCIGEVSALMILIGGAYMLVRKIITWHVPVAYIGTVAVLTFIFPRGNSPMEFMLFNVFGGGLMLGAFFMATDYTTSPMTHKGKLIFGIGCGLLTVFIRYFGSYNEGVCYSILVMNLFVPLIDAHVKPRRFGVTKSEKKEAVAK